MIQTKDCIEALAKVLPGYGKAWKRLSKRKDGDRFVREFQHRQDPAVVVGVIATADKIVEVVTPEDWKNRTAEGQDEVENVLKRIDRALGSKTPAVPKGKARKGPGKVEFYWQYETPDENYPPDPVFMITPKAYFDRTGALSDQGYGSEDFPEGCLPEGFVETQESEYEFNGTREEAERLLRADPRFEERRMFPEGERE